MAPSRVLWPAIALAIALTRSNDAEACRCDGPQDELVGSRLMAAPLNARFRVELVGANRRPTPIVRVHGGVPIATTARTWPDGAYTYIELTPTKLLQPNTLYEVVVVSANQFPSTLVIGALQTGVSSDSTAPTLDATGPAKGTIITQPPHTCAITGSSINIGPIQAADPGRPDAKLVYAIWLPDAAGKLDPTRPPNTLVTRAPWQTQNIVSVGRTSACDFHDLPLPAGNSVTLAIAAVDEAGNTSAPKKLNVDMQPWQ